MALRWFQSPKLVYLVVLHIVHMPIPWWDGDVIEHHHVVETVAHDSEGQGPPVVERYTVQRYTWDIDLILLGIDPPSDLDEGPLGDRRNHPEEEVYGECYVARTTSDDPSFRVCGLCVLLLETAAWRSDDDPAGARLPSPPLTPRSYSATHPGAQAWRIALSVIVC